MHTPWQSPHWKYVKAHTCAPMLDNALKCFVVCPHLIFRAIFWEDIAGMTRVIDRGPRFVGSKQV